MSIFEGFLLGITSSPYCFMATSPLLIPFIFSTDISDKISNIKTIISFLSGKFIGYIITGFILGMAGAYSLKYIDPVLQFTLKRLAYGLAGIILIVSGFSNRAKKIKSHNNLENNNLKNNNLKNNNLKNKSCKNCFIISKKNRNIFLLGLFSGLSLCPPFIAAATRVFSSSNQLYGVFYFAMFFAGTNALVFPFVFIHKLRFQSEIIREIANYVMIMLGIYFAIILGLLNWW